MEKSREEQKLVNKGKPAWRRGLKAEPFKHRQDPEFFAGACMMATQAISEFYAQGSTTMLLPMLYRLIMFTSLPHILLFLLSSQFDHNRINFY